MNLIPGGPVGWVCEACPVTRPTPPDRRCKDCEKGFCDAHLNEWGVCAVCWMERRPVAFFVRLEKRGRRSAEVEWWFCEVKKKGDFDRSQIEPFAISRHTQTEWGGYVKNFYFDVEEADPVNRSAVLFHSEAASKVGPVVEGLEAMGFRRIKSPADFALRCEGCGTREKVRETVDPKAAELDDVEIPMDLCPDCYEERKGDV
jgi:hypothetical protein